MILVPDSESLREFNGCHHPAGGENGGQFCSTQQDSQAFKDWFGNSKVVTATGEPMRVYHGARRGDRIGHEFKKSRATSGPSAFFTNDPEIASNYALSKQDTSLEAPESYAEWFRFTPKGARSSVPITQMWYYLTPEERQRVADQLPHVVNYDSDTDEELDSGVYKLDPRNYGLSGKDHWDFTIRQEARGNVIKAAVDIWLDGGSLVDSEDEFMTILKLGGVPMDRVSYESPHLERNAVFPVYLSIQKPLVTHEIPAEVMASLEKAARRQRKPSQEWGADPWDKRSRDPQHWMQTLRDDYAKGENSHAWSSIPDWVTATLKKHGYDGIRDTGGKMGGRGHDVWIPFEPTQIKSAVGNKGTFSRSKKRFTEARW